jgi:RNA polymerase sigma-70 factor (ECF subfamily)
MTLDTPTDPEELLRVLLMTHGAALRRIARVYAGATGEEEDLHQEILLQLWRGLPSFRQASAPGTWCYRVALNTALTWRRADTRRAARSAAQRLPAPGAADGGAMLAVLTEFLETLGPVDRSVLLLFMEGLSQVAIGEITGLSPAAVGVRVHRIRARFTREHVEDS